jgi:hypothetical protein
MVLGELLLVAAVMLVMEELLLGLAELLMQVPASCKPQDPQEYSTSGEDTNSTSRESW